MAHRFVCALQQLGWALALTVLSGLGIGLVVFTILSGALVVVWVGIPLTLAGLALLRPYADLHRRFAAWQLGQPVPSPYQPFRRSGPFGRLRDLGEDRSTWRDLLWLLLNATLGLALTILCTLEAVFHLLLFFLVKPSLLDLDALLIRRMLGADESRLLEVRVDELTASRAEAVDSSSAELRRIERDLHDGAQARLVALGMSLGLAEDLLQRDPDAALQLVTEARTATTAALTELRDLVRGIHPPVLADRGLSGALRALVLTSPIPVDLHAEVARLPAPVESAAYFAVCEMLTNAIKHSGASAVSITLTHNGSALQMSVVDNGHGGADPSRGTGMHGIARRLSSFDGTVQVTSPTGGPTTIRMELPCGSSLPKTSPSSATD
jgi:signal transduction histidine kinase